jgi:hypothetical protein
MSELERELLIEERKHRDGFPSPRRDVADLLLKAADELKRIREQVEQLEADYELHSRSGGYGI